VGKRQKGEKEVVVVVMVVLRVAVDPPLLFVLMHCICGYRDIRIYRCAEMYRCGCTEIRI
jgi:hypothetical protein